MMRLLILALLGGSLGFAPAVATAPGDPKLEWIAKPSEEAPKLPEKIPEAFAKLLDSRGIRLIDGDGKPLCELFLRREIPLEAKETSEMRVRLGNVAQGTFVGALNVVAPMIDYRNQGVAIGCYGLRVGWQPSDGNHLGTSDSRDFLVLTSLAHDKDPAPIGKLDDLSALSLPASSTDHLMALYVAIPESDPPKEGELRLYKRDDRDEWAADLTLVGRVAGAADGKPATTKLRIGLVLIGHISE